MAWKFDEKFEDYNEIELVNRALEELNEEWPWQTIIRKCLVLLKEKIEDK